MTVVMFFVYFKREFCGIKHKRMKTNYTTRNLPDGYEMSGVGAAPEEDSFVVMSGEAISKLRNRPGFFRSLFSGPYELSGTGADHQESGFVIQEMIERGIRR
jgi:hypothetical protein